MAVSILTLVFCLNSICDFAFGQPSDTVVNAINTLLLEPEVSEKVFFNYKGEWRGAGLLPDGTYAFICPDTTFQKVYPGILNRFPWAPDGYSYKIKFYKDSVRAIYVNGIVEYTLNIIFKKISVTGDDANIVFLTTSLLNEERFKGRYVLVTGCLKKEDGEWRVKKYDVKPINWIEYFHRKKVVTSQHR